MILSFETQKNAWKSVDWFKSYEGLKKKSLQKSENPKFSDLPFDPPRFPQIFSSGLGCPATCTYLTQGVDFCVYGPFLSHY